MRSALIVVPNRGKKTSTAAVSSRMCFGLLFSFCYVAFSHLSQQQYRRGTFWVQRGMFHHHDTSVCMIGCETAAVVQQIRTRGLPLLY